MPRELPEGLYEALVSLGLRDSLKASGLTSKFDDPDAGDSAQWFARYVSVELEIEGTQSSLSDLLLSRVHWQTA